MNLFEISKEIRAIDEMMNAYAIEHDGEVDGFPMLDSLRNLEGTRENKLLSLACLVVEREAEVGAIKATAQGLLERAKTKANDANRMREYITSNLNPGEKLEDARVKLGWRKIESVEVGVAPEMLPEEYRRAVTSVSADKTAIKEAIKSGKVIEGAEIKTKFNLQIK